MDTSNTSTAPIKSINIAFAPGISVSTRSGRGRITTISSKSDYLNIALPATRRASSSAPCMLFDKIGDIANNMFNPITTEAATAPTVPSKSRTVILVAGASGKTGRCIMKELVSSGIASKILAHVTPRADATDADDDIAKIWADSRIVVETISADLSTTTGVDTVISAAKSAGVGSVIYAASGGIDNCELVENVALEKLLTGLQEQLGSDTRKRHN